MRLNLETAVGSQKSAQILGTHRSLSQIRQIYCGCAGCGQIFRSFSGNVEKGPQLRSRAFGVLTYSVYAPRAKSPAALLDGLFEHSPFSLNSHHYSPQTIETSGSTQHPLVTIANLGQAPMCANSLHGFFAPNCRF